MYASLMFLVYMHSEHPSILICLEIEYSYGLKIRKFLDKSVKMLYMENINILVCGILKSKQPGWRYEHLIQILIFFFLATELSVFTVGSFSVLFTTT